MPDYSAFLDAIYDGLGIPACLDAAIPIALTIIDKTEGVVIDSTIANAHFGASKPAACVRVSELDANSIARDDLKGLTLSFGGDDWKIVSTQPKPKPGTKGELYLILQNA